MPDRFEGQDVFVVCGGSSLTGFDWDRLAGRRVVAVNRAWEVVPDADVIFSMDNRYYESIRESRQFKQHPGQKVWLARSLPRWSYDQDVVTVPVREGTGPSGPAIDISRGISHGENSGFAAMCLALGMGAKRVMMLGLDLVPLTSPGGMWWHTGYPPGWAPTETRLAIFRAFFEWAATFPEIHSRVFNCNPNSGVWGFQVPDQGDRWPVL